ncbi:MAG: hypothetical protein GTO18_18850 [Anaerolineales bacterium]|nr:hypothetical protein [Anaerolineales bacterium]
MTQDNSLDLYELLPALYRLRDAELDYPLRTLLEVIGDQAGLVKDNIDELWDDFFIETCADWVIPYIGDLVGNNPLHEAVRGRRADVAKTIYYRRRKGTLPMLEELARDVTGWATHAIEFFERLGWTQYMEHQRFQSVWTDVRNVEMMDRIDGPFDRTSRTIDVRRIAQDEGWYNIRNIGFFIWRLGSYPLRNVPARQAGQSWQYHFSPLGNPAPLFTRWRREGDEVGLATELHVPGPIRKSFFYTDLKNYVEKTPTRPDYTDLYGLLEAVSSSAMQPGVGCSFVILHNGSPIPPVKHATNPPATCSPHILCSRLDPWPAARPTGEVVLVDVETGRLVLGDGWPATTSLDVYYHYGFSADMGGGTYDRRKWMITSSSDTKVYRVKADGIAPAGAPPITHTKLIGTAASPGALDDWVSDGRPEAVINILDSRTYQLPAQIILRNEAGLLIQAANRQRPLLQTEIPGLDISVLPPASVGSIKRSGALTLDGLIVEGHIEISGDLRKLRLIHSTLIPGRRLKEDGSPVTLLPSLIIDGGPINARINTHLKVDCEYSLLGPVQAPDHLEGIWLSDSIVDGLGGVAISSATGTASAKLKIDRSTILGKVFVKYLDASDVIFDGDVEAVRRQQGCVRFSYVPPDSKTPRRYRCQPDLAVEAAIEEALLENPGLTQAERYQIMDVIEERLVPSFSTRVYGQPAYLQLSHRCPTEIRSGAENGAEIGAFNQLKQPQRESNLKMRLQEYLPFGLEAGMIFVT